MEKTLLVDGMVCAGCANTVQTRFQELAGVSEVDINLDAMEVRVRGAENISQADFNESLEGTNYSVSGEK